ncbi:MAG: ABC transporter permease [Lentisphaeria bacterium]|nr:ABC transporter permease [Lentisphaeria bacterium]
MLNVCKLRNKIRSAGTWGPFLALLVLLAVCCISSPSFRNVQNLLNITRQVSYSGIIALGMTFVIIGGGIDLAVGSLLAFTGCLALMAMNLCADPVMGLAVCIASAILLGCAGGAVNGLLVTCGKIPPFIATLGMFSIFRSLALYAADAGLVTTSNVPFQTLGRAAVLGIPFPALVLLVLTAVFSLILTRTAYGRHLCAVGANEKVARYAAISTGKVRFISYLIAGLTSGISAVLLGGRLNSVSSTNAGMSYELDAIAAVIIGGTAMSGGRGSMWGTLVGVLILGIVGNVLDMWGVSVNLQGTVKGAVIIAAVLIQRKR